MGVAALAIVCCAGLPPVVGLLGGLTLGGVLGAGGGLLAAAAVVLLVFVVLRSRRRRSCDTGARRGISTPTGTAGKS